MLRQHGFKVPQELGSRSFTNTAERRRASFFWSS